jgi:ribonuclease HII
VKPDFLLVDGNRFRPFDGYPYRTVVHGDATYASIAAASVLAKTWRDERMRELAQQYPGYGWEHNFGYPTPEHIDAIRRLGYTPEHRKSFHPKELEPNLFEEI